MIARQAAVAFVLGLLLGPGALAHGWYDPACCSDRDCARYPAEVTETGKAYVLADGRYVDMGDPRIRLSADGDFHVCERPDKSIICLYVPGRGT